MGLRLFGFATKKGYCPNCKTKMLFMEYAAEMSGKKTYYCKSCDDIYYANTKVRK